MKPLQKWFARRGALPLTCYLLALAAWLLLGIAHLAGDALAQSSGALYETAVPLTAWTAAGLEPAADGADAAVYTSTDGDPQLHWQNDDGLTVRTVSYTVQFDGEPREVCLYYTTAAGQDYSADRRVFPQSSADGRYVFTLPRVKIAALRLDPCSPDENKAVTMTFAPGAITLNAADTLPAAWQYFVPTWYQAFCLVLYPALAAAALSWAWAAVASLKKK